MIAICGISLRIYAGWVVYGYDCLPPTRFVLHTMCYQSGPWFNIKMSSYQFRKSHCGDKTVVRLFKVSLISTVGFPILVRWHLYIDSAPRVFFIQSRRIDHKHGKMLSDHRDAGLEKIWPRTADENLPTSLLIFCYLVKKSPWIIS